MIEVPTGDGSAPQEIEVEAGLPEALPVLPLKDSVPFPETLTPLAVGQERSVKLVNDVLGGNRMLVMVASRDGEIDNPSPEQLYGVGVVGTVARMIKVPDGTLRILVHGSQRVELGEFVQREPYLVARITEAARRGEGLRPARGPLPQRADHLLADHRAGPLPARGAAARGDQPRGSGRAGAHDRRVAADQDRGAPGAAGGARPRAPAAPPVGAARARAGPDLHRQQDPVPGRVRDGARPARVLPAPAAQGDPGRAGRGRRAGGGDPGAARAGGGGRAARARDEAGRARAGRASSACRRSPPSTG